MARVVEISIVQGLDGKTRAQQVARLKEWKKHFLKLGADKVVVKEAGPGNIDGAWIFEIHHKNAAAYGVAIDRLDAAQPHRWLSMARTDLQTGLMKMVRAVAQPTSF